MIKYCAVCGKKIEATAGWQKYCPECAYEVIRQNARERYRQKQRAKIEAERMRQIGLLMDCVTEPEIIKKTGTPSDTLCWDCVNAVPEVRNGRYYGCPWSEHLHEVEGWTVKRYRTEKKYEGRLDHIKVLDCPMFERDKE